jgi:hypothetical protein
MREGSIGAATVGSLTPAGEIIYKKGDVARHKRVTMKRV